MVNTEQKTFQKYPFTGDVCIRGMMNGLAPHTKVTQEPLVVRDKDIRPQEDPWRCTLWRSQGEQDRGT